VNGPITAGRESAPNFDIDVEAVSFSYPDGTQALQDVSLRIGERERVAIIGQNGSGKSTLVRHFNGLLRPTAGSVRLGGTPIGDRHVAEVARSVGIAFQNPDRQIFGRSVDAEVRFGARNVGLKGDELASFVAAALAQAGLTGLEALNPYDLGYSRRKLLGIASILAMRTPIVVLDEPTTGQDARGFERVASIVANLSAAGRTVIAISHDMRFVAENFERVVVMRAGTIAMDGTPAEVFAPAAWPTLESTFLEPPYPARVGAKLGLGSTPTDAALVEALRARS
jgi:energy-coupling factor transport system ATP-binding protein